MQRSPRHAARRRPAARTPRRSRREGMVLLVVMLILLMGTAMGGIALQTTQHEMRSAGHNRLATQTQYVADAALTTTTSWIDATSLNGSFYQNQLLGWQALPAPPDMTLFGEPEIDVNNRHWANRTQWQQQRAFLPFGVPPLTVPEAATLGQVLATDPFGTMGPRSAYVAGNEHVVANPPPDLVDYVADLYDCVRRPVAASPGSQVNEGGSGSLQQYEFYCVVTAHGRSFVPGSATKTWGLFNSRTYTPRRFMAAHEARATVITPPILIP